MEVVIIALDRRDNGLKGFMDCRDEGTKPLVYAFVQLKVGMGISRIGVYGDGWL